MATDREQTEAELIQLMAKLKDTNPAAWAHLLELSRHHHVMETQAARALELLQPLKTLAELSAMRERLMTFINNDWSAFINNDWSAFMKLLRHFSDRYGKPFGTV